MGAKNNIDGHAIAHIEKRHGVKGEADRSMADPTDLARIKYVLDNYDSVELLKNADGRLKRSLLFNNSDGTHAPMDKYTKRVNGHYYVVEAVPDARKRKVHIVSAYKNGQALSMSSAPTTPSLTSRTVLASESRISSGHTFVKGSEEYYRAVAQVFERIVQDTQSNSTVTLRSQVSRNKNPLVRGLFAFTSDAMQMYNNMYEGFREWHTMGKNYGFKSEQAKQGAKKAARGVTSYIVNCVVLAALSAAWDLIRGRKDIYEDEDGAPFLPGFSRSPSRLQIDLFCRRFINMAEPNIFHVLFVHFSTFFSSSG